MSDPSHPTPQHLWSRSAREALEQAEQAFTNGDMPLCIEKGLQSAEFSGKAVLSTNNEITEVDLRYKISHKLRVLFYDEIDKKYLGAEILENIEDAIADLTNEEFGTYVDCRYPDSKTTPRDRTEGKEETVKKRLRSARQIYKWHLLVLTEMPRSEHCEGICRFCFVE